MAESESEHVSISFGERIRNTTRLLETRNYGVAVIVSIWTFFCACFVISGVCFEVGVAFVSVFALLTSIGVCLSAGLFLLAGCLYHDESARPRCRIQCLEWMLEYIPQRLIAAETAASVSFHGRAGTVRRESESASTLAVDDLESSEQRNPQRPAVPQRPAISHRLNPRASNLPIEVDAQIRSGALESAQSIPSSTGGDSSSPFSSPHMTSAAILESLPTDTVQSPKQASTFSEVSELASESLTEVTPFASDENLEEGDRLINVRGGGLPESERISSGGAQNVASYERSSEGMSLPGQEDEVGPGQSTGSLRRHPTDAQNESFRTVSFNVSDDSEEDKK